MTFDIEARDGASSEFARIGAAVERLDGKLRELDRLTVEPKVRLGTEPATRDLTRFAGELRTKIQRAIRDLPAIDIDTIRAQARVASLKTRIEALRSAALRIDLDTGTAAADIGEIRRELEGLRDTRIKIDVTGGAKTDITSIAGRLRELRDTTLKVEVAAGAGIAELDLIDRKMTALRDRSPLRLVVDADDQAGAKLAAVLALAGELARSRPTVQATAETAAAAAQLAALLAQVRALAGREHTVRVRMARTGILGELARIQRDLRALAGGSIEIDADTRRLMEALASARVRLAELEALEPTVEIDADTAAARAQIAEIELALSRIAGRQYTARVDVDRDGSAAGRILALTGAAGALTAGLGSGTAAAASLGGAVASLAGLAPLAVSGLMGLVAVVATVKTGVAGLDEALSNLDDEKAFNAALRDLSPSAREFALAVRDIAPAWKEVRLETQQRLFAGLGDELQELSGNYLPLVKDGLGGIADELNGAGRDMAEFANSAEGVRDVGTIFDNTRAAMAAARPAAVDLLAAVTDIGVVGSEVGIDLGGGFAEATGRFREFIAEARRSGELEEWIRGGLDTLYQLGQVAGNVGGILGAVFTAAKESGADFLGTLERATGGVEDFLKSTDGQTALVDFFTESRQAVDATVPGLESAGRAAGQALSQFSNTGGLTTAATGFSDLTAAVTPLVPPLAKLGGEVLGAFGTAASAAAAPVGLLASGLVALLGAVGPIAPAAAGAFVAFKILGPVNTWVTGLGVSLAGLATRLGAGEAAATRIGAAFAKVGGAIPIVGAAVVGFAAIVDGLTSSTSEAVTALNQGGAAAADMQRVLLEQSGGATQNRSAIDDLNASVNEWLNTNVFGIATVDNTTAALAKQRAGMTDLERAQLDVKTATGDLQLAQDRYGAGSQQAAAAAAGLATANNNLETAERGAAAAGKDHNDVLRDQVNAAQTALGANLALEDALARVAAAETAANDAARRYGEGSTEAADAGRQFTAAADQAAQAVQKQAEATATATGAMDPAKAGTDAYAASLLTVAANASGPARTALLSHLSQLSQVSLDALSAGAATTGFATEVLQLPDGKSVTIAVDPETGKIVTTQQLLDSMAETKTITINGDTLPIDQALQRVLAAIALGQATVTIDGQTLPAQEALGRVLESADLAQATVTINGQDVPARGVLDAYLAAVSAGQGSVLINGNPIPADTVLTQLLGTMNTSVGTATLNANAAPATGQLNGTLNLMNGATGTMTLAANGAPASAVLNGTKYRIDTTTGTLTIDGNPAPGQADLSGLKVNIDRTAGTVTILGRDGGVAALKAQLSQPSSSVHTVRVRTVQETTSHVSQGGKGVAHGGILTPMAGGGILGATSTGLPVTAYAGGGYGTFNGHRLRPMAARAEAVPPGTFRVIGDNLSVTEIYAPLDGSARSLSFLRYGAQAFGMAMVPRSALAAITSAGVATPTRLSSSPPVATSGAPATSAGVTASVPAGGDQVAALRALAGEIRRSVLAATGAIRLDQSPVVAELRRVVDAVLTAGDPAAVVAGLTRVEQALAAAGRGSAAVSAQVRRTDAELAGLR